MEFGGRRNRQRGRNRGHGADAGGAAPLQPAAAAWRPSTMATSSLRSTTIAAIRRAGWSVIARSWLRRRPSARAFIPWLQPDRRTVVLGGCCTLMIGLGAATRDKIGRFGIAYIDGHLDLYDGQSSPSGEAADVPLATMLGHGDPDVLDAAGGASLSPDGVYLLGYRDALQAQGPWLADAGGLRPRLPTCRHAGHPGRGTGQGRRRGPRAFRRSRPAVLAVPGRRRARPGSLPGDRRPDRRRAAIGTKSRRWPDRWRARLTCWESSPPATTRKRTRTAPAAAGSGGSSRAWWRPIREAGANCATSTSSAPSPWRWPTISRARCRTWPTATKAPVPP